MAYGMIVAAIAAEEINRLQAQLAMLSAPYEGMPTATAAEYIHASHYHLSAGTGNADLDEAMRLLLDDGLYVSELYFHPYRPPLYLPYAAMVDRARAFRQAYELHRKALKPESLHYWDMEMMPIVDLADFAEKHHLDLMTFFDKPFDKERADLVHFPLDIFIPSPFDE